MDMIWTCSIAETFCHIAAIYPIPVNNSVCDTLAAPELTKSKQYAYIRSFYHLCDHSCLQHVRTS